MNQEHNCIQKNIIISNGYTNDNGKSEKQHEVLKLKVKVKINTASHRPFCAVLTIPPHTVT